MWKRLGGKKLHSVMKKYKRFLGDLEKTQYFLKKIFLCHVIAWHFRAIQSKNHCNAEIPGEKRSVLANILALRISCRLHYDFKQQLKAAQAF